MPRPTWKGYLAWQQEIARRCRIRRRQARRAAPTTGECSGSESRHHVRKDVRDLVAHGQKNDDDHNRDQNEDEGILNHALALLKVAQPVQVTHLLARRERFVTELVHRFPTRLINFLALARLPSA